MAGTIPLLVEQKKRWSLVILLLAERARLECARSTAAVRLDTGTVPDEANEQAWREQLYRSMRTMETIPVASLDEGKS